MVAQGIKKGRRGAEWTAGSGKPEAQRGEKGALGSPITDDSAASSTKTDAVT